MFGAKAIDTTGKYSKMLPDITTGMADIPEPPPTYIRRERHIGLHISDITTIGTIAPPTSKLEPSYRSKPKPIAYADTKELTIFEMTEILIKEYNSNGHSHKEEIYAKLIRKRWDELEYNQPKKSKLKLLIIKLWKIFF